MMEYFATIKIIMQKAFNDIKGISDILNKSSL